MTNKIIVSILSGFIIVDALLIYIALSITPVKLKRNSFTYEYGEQISTQVSDYVNANPTVLKNIKLDLSAVSTEVGTYKASVQYQGDIQNFEIKVVDTVKPKVQLKQVQFNVHLGKTLCAADLIKEVEDQSKTTVYFYDEESKQKNETKTYNQAGSYIEKIIVEDAHGNQSAALRVKIVVEANHILPVIKGADDVEIEKGEEFDLYDGVTATDDIEGDITERINVDGVVNSQEAGTYYLTYTVSDKDGNTAKVIRKVIVKEDDN